MRVACLIGSEVQITLCGACAILGVTRTKVDVGQAISCAARSMIGLACSIMGMARSTMSVTYLVMGIAQVWFCDSEHSSSMALLMASMAL